MKIEQGALKWIPNKTMISELRLPRRDSYWIAKRVLDIFASAMALLILSPLLLLIMLFIVLDDPHGGPFFSQLRCGRGGRQFRMYKFRTMYVDAEKKLDSLLKDNEMEGPAFKMKNDPRITRFGKILRATGLDELPQFYNILKGEMTLVGPRPPLPREVALYNEYQFQRLYVTPGLTCYWQIAPNRNDITFDEWVEMDIKYVIERSFWGDIRILFKTAGTVFTHSGR